MIRFSRIVFFAIAFFSLPIALLAQAAQPGQSSIPLSTSKWLTVPSPGRIGSTNSFPATIAISPNGRYAALLNDGYGTQETLGTQSIAVLDLKTNRLADYPDKRFGENAHQSYFLGLVFGSDGKHLYASVGSITDPSGEKEGDTGNGIAVYKFHGGKVEAERFIPIGPQTLAAEKKDFDRIAEDGGGESDSLSGGAGAGWRRTSGRPQRSTPCGEQSFRQCGAAGCGERQGAAEF